MFMDGRITISIILLIFFILVIILGINERRKENKKHENLIKKLYGKKRKKPELTENYKDYFNYNKSDSFYIDDTTASDVDLDSVFSSINHTYSVVGEEYLYYMLRTPSFDDDQIKKNEGAISFFTHDDNRNLSLELQKLFFKLGKYKKIDLFSFIEKIKNNKK